MANYISEVDIEKRSIKFIELKNSNVELRNAFDDFLKTNNSKKHETTFNFNRVDSDDGNAALITTTDNYSYSDKWHYDTAGYIDFGKQFAIEMLQLLKKKIVHLKQDQLPSKNLEHFECNSFFKQKTYIHKQLHHENNFTFCRFVF